MALTFDGSAPTLAAVTRLATRAKMTLFAGACLAVIGGVGYALMAARRSRPDT